MTHSEKQETKSASDSASNKLPAVICKHCLQLDTDVPSSKYCERSPGSDPQGKDSHKWIDLISDEGIKLRDSRINSTSSIRAEYNKLVKLIDQADTGSESRVGAIIELATIGEINVKWHDDFEERLSLYELIIKRIREHAEQL